MLHQLRAARTAQTNQDRTFNLHVEYFERHRFSERAIVKRLKLEFLSAVFPPESVPFFTFLSGGNVDLPVNVFAGDAAMRAGNRVNGLVAAESLAAVDAYPRAIAQRSMSHNGRYLRHPSATKRTM